MSGDWCKNIIQKHLVQHIKAQIPSWFYLHWLGLHSNQRSLGPSRLKLGYVTVSYHNYSLKFLRKKNFCALLLNFLKSSFHDKSFMDRLSLCIATYIVRYFSRKYCGYCIDQKSIKRLALLIESAFHLLHYVANIGHTDIYQLVLHRIDICKLFTVH